MSTPIFDNVANDTVTTDAEGTPTLKPNAKVLAGIVAGIVVTLGVAMLSAVTPEMLGFAGQFTPVIFAGVGAIVAIGTAYLKRPVG